MLRLILTALKTKVGEVIDWITDGNINEKGKIKIK